MTGDSEEELFEYEGIEVLIRLAASGTHWLVLDQGRVIRDAATLKSARNKAQWYCQSVAVEQEKRADSRAAYREASAEVLGGAPVAFTHEGIEVRLEPAADGTHWVVLDGDRPVRDAATLKSARNKAKYFCESIVAAQAERETKLGVVQVESPAEEEPFVPKSASVSFDLLIKNAAVACCDRNETTYRPGAVGVKDGRIAWVGPAEDLPDAETATTIDASGKLLAAGLVNAHCHTPDSLFRGLVEDKALEDWLNVLWKAEGAILNEETNYLGARLGLAELALGGVTTVLDMFWFPETMVAATKKIGMRMMTGGSAFDLATADGMEPNERIKHADDFIRRYQDEELVTPIVMAHGAYTVGKQNLQASYELANSHKCMFHIHAAETKKENQTVRRQHGDRVIPALKELGMLGPRTLLAHTVHLKDEEILMLAETRTKAVHNPVSNLKLGSGFARIPEMLRSGVTIGLGTDGPVSGNDIDMWMALRLAAIMHRGHKHDCVAVSSQQALRMATLEGAKALGMEKEIGSIETGKRADLMLLDLQRAHATPCFDPHRHLVYSACKGDVEAVWVGGRAVVADYRLVNDELDEILEEVRRLQPAILASIK